MTTLPLTIKQRTTDQGHAPCAKCKSLKLQEIKTATNDLTQGAQIWPLCNNHAAAAVSVHNLYHSTFNPTGKKPTTKE